MSEHATSGRLQPLARGPVTPGGQSASAAIDFRAPNATFCVAAQRPLADLRPAPNGGSRAPAVTSDSDAALEPLRGPADLIADSAWLTHALVTRLAPCRSAKSVQVSRRASSRKAAAMAAAMNRHMRPNPGQGPGGSAGEFWPHM
jgi:hypothetical protein